MSTAASDAEPGAALWGRFDAVLFDLDGVITPTADVHQQAWREVFEEVLAELAEGEQRRYRDDDYHLHIDGRSRYDGVHGLLAAHDVSLPWGDPSDPPGLDTVCAVGNKKNAVFVAILERDPISAFPGSLAVMAHLDAIGVTKALVSSSANAKLVLGAAGLTDAFEVIIDGNVIRERGLNGKPHPDPFLEAARELGLAADRCVVVEDAIPGVESGAAGGFGLVIGVARDTEPEALRAVGADLVVADLGELA